MTLYESIMLAGVPTSNHESDLYFPMTAETRAILSQYPTEDKNSHVFRNNMDGATWFDVPFAYTPWWEARANKPTTPEAFNALVSEDLEAHPEARSMPEVFTLGRIAEFCAARDTGRRVEVSEDLFEYFLGVLPPVRMGYLARVRNESGNGWIQIYASFGFAEGCEMVTAFWPGINSQKTGERENGRYFAQLTDEMNRG